MTKKIKKINPEDWAKIRLESLERLFKEKSDQFIWQTQQGGGIKNIHMLDTIRDLQMLYLQIAAHHDALRSLKVQI